MQLLVFVVIALLGAAFVALAIARHSTPIALLFAVVGTGLVLYSMVEIFDPNRIRGTVVPTLLGIAAITLPTVVILAIVAYRLWVKHANHPTDELRANLAIALGAGAAVTFMILLVQTTVQVVDYQQNLENQRQSIRLSLATEPDLSGLAAPIDPADGDLLDMSGFWFRGKKMAFASLNSVQLRGANFVFTDLSGALMRGVDLSQGDGRRTDLRAASLYWADLTDAEIASASFVDADLRRVYLCGADLREANLTRTDLREAFLDVDPQSGEPCGNPALLPPRSQYPTACWPEEIDAHDGCGAEARLVVCQRDGRVPQRPEPDVNEPRCESEDG